MKLHLGALPDDFEPDESWRTIVEPSPLWLQVVAAPIALLSGAIFFFTWRSVIDMDTPHIPAGWELAWQWAIIGSFPLLIFVHEVIHAVCYPGYGLGKETLIGCWPSRMLFYAYYNGPMSRDRFLTVFAMPFLVISVLPLALASLISLPEILSSVLAWFSIWNAIFACGDMIGFALILFQVDRRALVRNKSWRSYWKPLSVTPMTTDLSDQASDQVTLNVHDGDLNTIERRINSST